jgi:hypothetical protein
MKELCGIIFFFSLIFPKWDRLAVNKLSARNLFSRVGFRFPHSETREVMRKNDGGVGLRKIAARRWGRPVRREGGLWSERICNRDPLLA